MGRPRKDAATSEGVALVEQGMALEDAAAKLTAAGRPVSGRTLRRALAAVGKAVPVRVAPVAPVVTAPTPPIPLPPPDSGPLDLDPLATLARVQSGLERDLARLPVEQVVQRRAIASVLVQVAKGAESIRRERPPDDGPDEVTERIEARRADAVKKILQHTAEAGAKLAKDRAELAAWAALELAPRAAQELERRIGVMLHGAPS